MQPGVDDEENYPCWHQRAFAEHRLEPVRLEWHAELMDQLTSCFDTLLALKIIFAVLLTGFHIGLHAHVDDLFLLDKASWTWAFGQILDTCEDDSEYTM